MKNVLEVEEKKRRQKKQKRSFKFEAKLPFKRHELERKKTLVWMVRMFCHDFEDSEDFTRKL